MGNFSLLIRGTFLAKNDTILIDGIIAQRMADGTPSTDKGEAFEYFSFEQLLKKYDLSQEEIESGWVDGRNDGGIDGIFLFVNGHLVLDITTFHYQKENSYVDLFVISCKHHDTFRESTLNTLVATAQELFDFSLDEFAFRGSYSSDVLDHRRSFVYTYKKIAITNPSINIHYIYASRGDANDIGESINARASQIIDNTAKFFSNANVDFKFIGSKELIEKYRTAKQFALELPFLDYLTGSGEGYIAVVKLFDYYNFVSDEEESLRRYLFDSNVRDYIGNNKVNNDIAESLEDETIPDFWWLNNGITILATNAVINGKIIMLKDIQVVNGLQTTETIYRHFKAGTRVSQHRTLAIKIIV